jgi:polar amino acid transport system substrate-binding protein
MRFRVMAFIRFLGDRCGMMHAALRVIVPLFVCCAVSPGDAAAQALDRIAATKMVRIGFIADQAPFASKGTDDKPAGYAIDLCDHVAAEIGGAVAGVQSIYVETTLALAFDAVANDQIDLLCGAITVTVGRRETVDFSEPIFMTGMSGLLRADAPRDLRELFLGERTISPPRSPTLRPYATSRIGVRDETTTEARLRRAIAEEGYGAAVLDFTTHKEGLAALESGEIDAYFGDRALLAGLLEQAQDTSRLMLANRLFTREPYGIAMKRGDADLRLFVDRTLSDFYSTPEYTALLEKYFPEEAPVIRAEVLAHSVSD